MKVAFGDPLVLPGLPQLLARVRPGRLKQPVARLFRVELGADERLVDERRDDVEGFKFVELVVRSDCCRALKREAVDEDSEPPKESTLALGEQVVTPIDQRAQGLLARQDVTAAAGEHAEPLIQTSTQFGRPQNRNARGGQFDRECNTVEAAADVGDDRRRLVGEFKTLVGGARPFDE